MSFSLKIILPIVVLLFIVISAFGYILYNLKLEEKLIAENSNRIRPLNSLNEQLNRQQNLADLAIFSYLIRQEESFIDEIKQTELERSRIINEMFPLIASPKGQDLAKKYNQKRQEGIQVRNELIQSIKGGKKGDIEAVHNRWLIQSQQRRAALADLDVYNINSLERTLLSVEEIRKQISQIVTTLAVAIVVLIIILYFYLRQMITKPLIKLSKAADRLSKSDFTTTTTTTVDVNSHDEIGVLANAFKNMASKLKSYYAELKGRVKKRTSALLKTKEEQLRHEISLEQKERDFVSMASHQLLTPIALIQGYLSMLLSGKYVSLDIQTTNYLNESLKGAKRMARLVKDLLTTSRIESGHLHVEKQEFDLSTVLLEVLKAFRPKAEQKHLRFKINIPKGSYSVLGDSHYTREVLNNIIDNAIKYTQKGTVTLRMKKTNGFVSVLVADTGIGIERNDLPNIFDKFYLSKNWITTQSQSHGLGLYISRLLIGLMSGTITAESKVGKGSNFTISLPTQ